MTTLDITAIASAFGLLLMTGRLVKAWIMAGYNFTKDWQEVKKFIADIAAEMKTIRENLADGKEWMIRGDERFKRHDEDIGNLREQVAEHAERIARVEGGKA